VTSHLADRISTIETRLISSTDERRRTRFAVM